MKRDILMLDNENKSVKASTSYFIQEQDLEYILLFLLSL